MIKLAKRERYLVSLAAFSVAVFLLFQFLIFPFFERRERIQRGIKAKEEDLVEILKLAAEYQRYTKSNQEIAQSLSRRAKGFTLFSFLERSADEAGVKDHIKYMKPSTSKGTGLYKESLVEMEVDQISLSQLANYLHRIESSENFIKIKRISIKENQRESGYIDAVMQVLTFQ